jgi:hypothetical protein
MLLFSRYVLVYLLVILFADILVLKDFMIDGYYGIRDETWDEDIENGLNIIVKYRFYYI